MPFTAQRPCHPAEISDLRGANKFGISPGYMPGVAYQAAHMDVVKDLGARWIRLDINWALCEPTTQGTFDWSQTDAMIANAASRNLRVLACFDISTPSWAKSSGGGTTLPTDPFNMALFAVAAQNRYPWIRHWEIGNEINLGSNMVVPNVAGYGSPASSVPSGKAYAFLMRAIYPRMKAKDPDCVILTSGISGTDTSGINVNEVEFLLNFYDYAGQNYCDAVGFHPYSQPLRAGELMNLDTNTSANYQQWSAWGRMSGYPAGDGIPTGAVGAPGSTGRQRGTRGGTPVDVSLSSIREMMTFYGDAWKKIWITEFGASTYSSGVSQAEQVEQVKRAYSMANSLDWVGPLFWYSAKDLAADGLIGNSWGLQTSAGTNKTAYATYKALALGASG